MIDFMSLRDADGHGTYTAPTVAESHTFHASIRGYVTGIAKSVTPKARLTAYKGVYQTGARFVAKNCNRKLIGARFFSKGHEAAVGQGGPIVGINQTIDFMSLRDVDGHGTHTTSTIAESHTFHASMGGYAVRLAKGEGCQVSLKLLVDTKRNKVLLAEAGKDFVDFLFNLLSSPVDIAISLLDTNSMTDSLGNLYIITIFNKFNIKGVGTLQKRVVHLGMNEGLKLLKVSLQSKSV
ncbi:hypothetical protein V6N11_072745 [Hibiscus sabdariffa]|uniref:Uncharacterized protein n=1 Tax=Hibiscus sabdariffa TaxID=183260 RepID=A0ABR2NE20_9ROSI